MDLSVVLASIIATGKRLQFPPPGAPFQVSVRIKTGQPFVGEELSAGMAESVPDTNELISMRVSGKPVQDMAHVAEKRNAYETSLQYIAVRQRIKDEKVGYRPLFAQSMGMERSDMPSAIVGRRKGVQAREDRLSGDHLQQTRQAAFEL